MGTKIKSTAQEISSKLKIKEISSIFGFVVAPFIIVFSIKKYIDFSEGTFELILTSTISAILILLLVFLVIREIMSGRKEKYANITEQMHYSSHISRDILSYLDDVNVEELEEKDKQRVFTVVTSSIIDILDRVSITYSMLTGTHCRAAIKTVYEKDGKLYVRTLARDTTSYESNYKTDKKRYNNNYDLIEENDDFDLLYNDESMPGESYFFCNNLIKRRNYDTSSFKVYEEPGKELNWYDIMFCKGWTLPYRSTIVWPIQQRKNRCLYFDEIGCIGFLAVDSDSRGVFNKKWDPWLGASIADTIFHPIKKLYNIVD